MVGSTALVVIASMVLLPGPGLIAIPFGVAMLLVELVWWWRIRRRLQDQVRSMTDANGAAPGENGSRHGAGTVGGGSNGGDASAQPEGSHDEDAGRTSDPSQADDDADSPRR